MKEEHDAREGYCPMLGHFLTFRYCRTMKEGLPCGRVLDCWHERFDVQGFIGKEFSEDEQQRIFAPAKPKLSSLLDLLEQAQKRRQQGTESDQKVEQVADQDNP